jgi:2-keto-3-deoxy-L-rhamnonate aldolase RhmA
VFAAAERIVRSAEANGVAVGVFTNSEQDALRWLSAGMRYLCLSVDTVFLLNAMGAGLAALRRKFDFH